MFGRFKLMFFNLNVKNLWKCLDFAMSSTFRSKKEKYFPFSMWEIVCGIISFLYLQEIKICILIIAFKTRFKCICILTFEWNSSIILKKIQIQVTSNWPKIECSSENGQKHKIFLNSKMPVYLSKIDAFHFKCSWNVKQNKNFKYSECE